MTLENSKIDSKMTTSIPELKKFLASNVCKEAGIVSLSINQEDVLLGAMNPIYKNVQNIIQKLEADYTVNVKVKQISPEEFEKWDETSNPISFKDNKSFKELHKLGQEVNKDDENKPTYTLPPNININEDKNDNSIDKPATQKKSILKELLENSNLNKNENGFDNSIDKFDFFELEEEEEEEEEEERRNGF